MKHFTKLLLSLALATPAFAGPDFSSTTPSPGSLAASSGEREIEPSEDLVFPLDSAILHDAEHRQIITAAHWLRARPRYTVLLEGYADASGASIYNEDLAMRRAAAVRAQLIARGVSAERIMIAVYGEARSIDPNNALDRRVIMHATKLPLTRLITSELDRGAISVTWQRNGALFTEVRGKQAPRVSTR